MIVGVVVGVLLNGIVGVGVVVDVVFGVGLGETAGVPLLICPLNVVTLYCKFETNSYGSQS